MRFVTAEELKVLDPKRFEEEYVAWREYADAYEWWDSEYEYFIDKWEKQGLVVAAKDICWSGFWSQGDGLGFSGYMRADEFMEKHGYHETHLALYLDVQNYGGLLETARLGYHAHRITHVDFSYSPCNCYPPSVFKGLSHEAWDALVQEQYDEVFHDIEEAALKFFQDCADELYKALEKTWEDITSVEVFIENCGANGLTFEIETDGVEYEIQN